VTSSTCTGQYARVTRASHRSIAILGAPTSAGAHAPGQERAPEALREAGLVDRIRTRGVGVHDLGDLPRFRWTADRAHRRAQLADDVARIARSVADTVATAPVLDDADALLVLGGDCTIEAGVVSGFARRGATIGLVYLDAGPDLNVPTSVRLGFLDWMGMAHVLGLPEATTPLGSIGPTVPLLDADHVVFVGAVRDELTEWEHRMVQERALAVFWEDEVKASPVAATRAAVAALPDDVDCLLVHFDLDVVDFLDFPAADFPTINAGLELGDALACVAELARHPAFSALTICEFNPDHVDEEHRLVQQFVADLVDSVVPGFVERAG
jgi:arginase